jgi:hypothetical protein
MRYLLFAGLLCWPALPAQEKSEPKGQKTIKDSKGVCQITVPDDWNQSTDTSSAAVFKDASTAIAVVTSQPGQVVKPLSEALQKSLGIPREKMFENTAKRIYYQDRIAANVHDSNAFSAMVPGKNGTCSSRVVYTSPVTEETAKKITLSVAPVPE